MMQRIINEGQTFSRRVTTDEDARQELQSEPYKLELIGLKGSGARSGTRRTGRTAEVGGGELTIYDNLRRDGDAGLEATSAAGRTCPPPS